jgi:hypothetical protein
MAAVSSRGALPGAVGVIGGSLLVLLAGFASPLAAGAAIAGAVGVALIFAVPYWGFLVTAALVPLERVGRFTNDSSLTTVSLIRVAGTITLAAFLLHALLKRRRIQVTTPGYLYAAYFAVGLLSLSYTSDLEYGIRTASAILGNLVFFVLVVNVVRTPAQARAAIAVWLAVTVAIGVFTMYQWRDPAAIIVEDRFNSTGERTGEERFSTILADDSEFQALEATPRALGTTSHPAVYGINLILTLPFFAYLFRTMRRPIARAAIAAAAGVTCYNVVLTNTRGAVITMALVIVVIALTRLIRVTPAAVGGVLLAGALAIPFMPGAIWDRVLNTSNYSVDRSDTLRARLSYWEEGLSMASENWLLGIGIGNQTELPRRLQSRMYMPPNSTVHNEYLQSLLETGLAGYPLLIAFVVVLYRRARRSELALEAAGDIDGALLFKASRIAVVAVLFYATHVDVLHFPLKGWWLAMGIVVALSERMTTNRRAAAAA